LKNQWICSAAFGAIVIPLAACYLHLGPAFGLIRGPIVLDSVSLGDGSLLLLVAKRNPSLSEAYNVTLYRRDDLGAWSCAQLGFEESFWWFGKINSVSGNSNVLALAYYGAMEFGRFDNADQSVLPRQGDRIPMMRTSGPLGLSKAL
jgi:hypothetical protein